MIMSHINDAKLVCQFLQGVAMKEMKGAALRTG